jgi:hypothetical protein
LDRVFLHVAESPTEVPESKSEASFGGDDAIAGLLVFGGAGRLTVLRESDDGTTMFGEIVTEEERKDRRHERWD